MATAKTESTELSIGFGLLQLDPTYPLSEPKLRQLFDNLTYQKYHDFIREFWGDERYYRRFYAVGLNLRQRYPSFQNAAIGQISWQGPNRQATTVSLPIDLVLLNTPISIKDDSDVVYNRSPHNFSSDCRKACLMWEGRKTGIL